MAHSDYPVTLLDDAEAAMARTGNLQAACKELGVDPHTFLPRMVENGCRNQLFDAMARGRKAFLWRDVQPWAPIQ